MMFRIFFIIFILNNSRVQVISVKDICSCGKHAAAAAAINVEQPPTPPKKLLGGFGTFYLSYDLS